MGDIAKIINDDQTKTFLQYINCIMIFVCVPHASYTLVFRYKKRTCLTCVSIFYMLKVTVLFILSRKSVMSPSCAFQTEALGEKC